MQMRMLRKKEIAAAKELWRYAFQDPESFIDWYFSHKIGGVLGGFEGNTLITQMVLVPATISVRGMPVKANLVSGVATRPEYRGKGLMKDLIPEGYRVMREAGVSLAALYPFDYDFYRRYGWEIGSDVLRVRASLQQLPLSRMAGGFELVKEPALALREFCGIYEACFGGFSGHVLRDEQAFALRLEEHAQDEGYAALYRQGEEIMGYMLYHMEGKLLGIDEVGMLTAQGRRDTLTFLAQHSSTQEEVIWACPQEDAMWRLIGDNRRITTLESFAMFRIISLEGLSNGLPAGCGEAIIRVKDDQAPWNAGCWLLEAKDHRLTTRRADETESAIDLTIGALAQWVVGYRSGEQLLEMGQLADAGAVAKLDGLLSRQKTFMYEMY